VRYGFCVIRKDENVLLIRRSGTAPYRPNEWDLPGGTIQPEEEVVDGTKREIEEETSLDDLELYEITTLGGARLGFMHEFHYFASHTNGVPKLSYEHSEFQWCSSPEEALSLITYKPHKKALECLIKADFYPVNA